MPEIHQGKQIEIFKVLDYNEFKYLLTPQNTTAVIALVGNGSHYVLVNHYKRGWDVPGGHIENNETPIEALIREVREETGGIVRMQTPL